MRSIKKLLLNIKPIYLLNKEIKKKKVKTQYNKISQHYELMESASLSELLLSKGFTKDWFYAFQLRKCKVLFIGTDENQDKGGFVQSLSKFFDVKFFEDPTINWGHKRDGSARDSNAKLLEKYLCKEAQTGLGFDIVLMQAMGKSFNSFDLMELRERYKFKLINIGMDERLAYKLNTPSCVSQNYGISGLNDVVDLCLTTCPEVVDWYLKEKVPAIYFPLASSKEIYFPISSTRKIFDVGFVGSKYGARVEIIEFLIKNGINVKCYGPGWTNGPLEPEFNNQFYNECKIVLGFGGIGYCEDFTNPKLRDFEVPLTGTLYMTTYTKELDDIYCGDEGIVLFKNKIELLEKIRIMLNDDSLRQC
ncbi:glycosyltransferase family 1 protein, partial [Vibrio vulnificus]|nr:glycosyltransferase family 1 protein [Vibrio vulnificus]